MCWDAPTPLGYFCARSLLAISAPSRNKCIMTRYLATLGFPARDLSDIFFLRFEFKNARLCSVAWSLLRRVPSRSACSAPSDVPRFLRVKGFDDPDLLEAFPGLAVAAPESEPKPKKGPALAQGEGAEGRVEGGQEEEEEELKAASHAEAECALLERAAHYALMMNADLQVWEPFPYALLLGFDVFYAVRKTTTRRCRHPFLVVWSSRNLLYVV